MSAKRKDTSSINVAIVGKSPNVAEAHGEAESGENEVNFGGPIAAHFVLITGARDVFEGIFDVPFPNVGRK